LLRVTVGLVLGAVILSGCAAKEKASTTLPAPTSTAAPTTAALPPLGPPDFPVPAAARTKDAAGAEAFVRYWIDLLNRQQTIPAGEPLRELGPQCQDCLRIARTFDSVAAARRKYVGGGLRLNDVPPAVMHGDTAVVSFGVRREAVRIVDASGQTVNAGFPLAPNESSGCNLVWSATSHGWLLKDFTIG
jgi:hypothetical protein